MLRAARAPQSKKARPKPPPARRVHPGGSVSLAVDDQRRMRRAAGLHRLWRLGRGPVDQDHVVEPAAGHSGRLLGLVERHLRGPLAHQHPFSHLARRDVHDSPGLARCWPGPPRGPGWRPTMRAECLNQSSAVEHSVSLPRVRDTPRARPDLKLGAARGLRRRQRYRFPRSGKHHDRTGSTGVQHWRARPVETCAIRVSLRALSRSVGIPRDAMVGIPEAERGSLNVSEALHVSGGREGGPAYCRSCRAECARRARKGCSALQILSQTCN